MNFSIIVAVDKNFGIGKAGTLPWHLPEDLKHFADVTTTVHDPKKQNAVIMGRRTFESIPESRRPLKNRVNIVLTRRIDPSLAESVKGKQLFFYDDFDNALKTFSSRADIENIFVIGGGEVFKQAINHPLCEKIYLTQINKNFDCDTFFPKIDPEKFKLADKSPAVVDNGIEMNFLLYEK